MFLSTQTESLSMFHHNWRTNMPSAKVDTYPSRNVLDIMYPNPECIHIEDIAHALSMIPRWTGHTRFPYTVGQHSIWCYRNVYGKELGLQALLHDATEAYMQDLASPIKKQCLNYQLIEGRLWSEIAKKFGVPEILDPRVKEVDAAALIRERMVLKGQEPIVSADIRYQHWRKTKRQFLDLFYRLTYKAKIQQSWF